MIAVSGTAFSVGAMRSAGEDGTFRRALEKKERSFFPPPALFSCREGTRRPKRAG
jgi:hypothetical protein